MDRRRWGEAQLAVVIGVALLPTAMLARDASVGPTVLAVVSIAIAVLGATAIAARARGVPRTAIAGLMIGSAPAVALAARGWTDLPIAGAGPLHQPFMTESAVAIGAAALSFAGAHAAVWASRRAWGRRAAMAVAVACAVCAIGIGARALVRGEGPSAGEALAQLEPAGRFEALTDGATQREIVGGVTLERACVEGFCGLVVHPPDGARLDDGVVRSPEDVLDPSALAVRAGTGREAHPLSGALGRAPLAIFRTVRTVAVAPMVDGRARWDRALVFESSRGRYTSLGATELAAALGVPRVMRAAAWLGILISLVALIAAWATRLRADRIARGIEGEVDEHGLIRLPGGALARAARPVAVGPVLVLGLETGTPTYREDGIALAREVLPGGRTAGIEALSLRAVALDLAAVGAIALSHAPLLTAWIAGYSVMGG